MELMEPAFHKASILRLHSLIHWLEVVDYIFFISDFCKPDVSKPKNTIMTSEVGVSLSGEMINSSKLILLMSLAYIAIIESKSILDSYWVPSILSYCGNLHVVLLKINAFV